MLGIEKSSKPGISDEKDQQITRKRIIAASSAENLVTFTETILRLKSRGILSTFLKKLLII